MFKKNLTLVLTILVLNLSLSASVFAKTNSDKEAKLAEKVKVGITKLGTGQDAQVKIKLKDGTKLNGYISEINADSFVVINEKSGVATEVPYSSPKQIKGNNLSNGAWLAIGIGLAVGLIIITIIAGRSG